MQLSSWKIRKFIRNFKIEFKKFQSIFSRPNFATLIFDENSKNMNIFVLTIFEYWNSKNVKFLFPTPISKFKFVRKLKNFKIWLKIKNIQVPPIFYYKNFLKIPKFNWFAHFWTSKFSVNFIKIPKYFCLANFETSTFLKIPKDQNFFKILKYFCPANYPNLKIRSKYKKNAFLYSKCNNAFFMHFLSINAIMHFLQSKFVLLF